MKIATLSSDDRFESAAPDLRRQTLRVLTMSVYDLQKLRIQTGNRIAGNFRVKLGQNPGTKLEEKEAQKTLKTVRAEYARLTDSIATLSRTTITKLTQRSGLITDAVEFYLVRSYVDLLIQEQTVFREIAHVISFFPVWSQYLLHIKGVGPAMGAVIVSSLDPARARHPSSFWRYAGLDVGEDGRGRSRRKEHLITTSYTNRDGQPATKLSITFNPFVKTKIMGVLAPSFLRAKNEGYTTIYYDYRNRLLSHPDHASKTKGHQHNMALRYMIKIFLLDLWLKWRELEGLETHASYAEAKLGLKHAAVGR
ncbi:MAG: transposase [Syntrophobacteraceae bacterium]